MKPNSVGDKANWKNRTRQTEAQEASLKLQTASAAQAFDLARNGLATAKAEHFALAAAEAQNLHAIKLKLDVELASANAAKQQLNESLRSLEEEKRAKALLPGGATKQKQKQPEEWYDMDDDFIDDDEVCLSKNVP